MSTSNFGMTTPAFGASNWHTPINNNLDLIDAILARIVNAPGGNCKGLWVNNTAYVLDDIVVDFDGAVFKCAVAHTSATSPTTFTTDRTSNPTYWNAISIFHTSGEALGGRRQVVAQAATEFNLTGLLDSTNPLYGYRISGSYKSTAGTPGNLEFRFTNAGTPITGTYRYSYRKLGTGAGAGSTSATNYAPISNAMSNGNPVSFILDVILHGTNKGAAYKTWHYDSSAFCTNEGMIDVATATAVDGVQFLNTGTTIDASAAVIKRPMG